MRPRRAALLALCLLIAAPIAPALATEPPSPPPLPSEPIFEPSPSLEPTPSEDPAPSADPAPTDEATPTASAPAEEPTPTAEPSVDPEADPMTEPDPTASAPDAEATPAPAKTTKPANPRAPRGGLDPRNRYIVVLDNGVDLASTVTRQKRLGARVERTFRTAFHGYVATLTSAQRQRLAADPSVQAIVPDEIVELTAQHVPTGIRRIKATASDAALINGLEPGINADVAIVDTGIDATHPDLRVAGGYNCSTSDRTLWRDRENHGTHVAGTVGAKDNGYGVVGVAPGVRLWAVKILNDDGFGYLSWYVCGLDWILAQRDASDPSRPMIEAANMSVAKSGDDDPDCGLSEKDILHLAICRVVKGGITVVAAAGNDRMSAARWVPAAYNEVITVSALADTDGKPNALGGHRCFSWGSYDSDDTYANFSNYGADVDIIAPGKCIWSTKPGSTYGYMSGTSMATPHVTGAAALYKASRPMATPAEVKEALQYLGNLKWKTSTDPDSYHEKLLDVSKLGPLGTFSLASSASGVVPETGGPGSVAITIDRSSTFFERVKLSVSGIPEGWTARLDRTSVLGWTAKSAALIVTAPASVPAGTYQFTVTGTNQGRSASVVAEVVVGKDLPTAVAPSSVKVKTNLALNASSAATIVSWAAATDLSSAIAGYQFQWSRDGGAWSSTIATTGSVRTVVRNLAFGSSYHFR